MRGHPSNGIGETRPPQTGTRYAALSHRMRFDHNTRNGVPQPEKIAPESYTLDAALIARPGNADIQLDLFRDYANNVTLYPAFQQYLRSFTPPLLAIWGSHDAFFVPAGAEAFRRDLPSATVQLLDAGHFALETHLEQIVESMRTFLRGTPLHDIGC